MNTILPCRVIHISKFKKNPAKAVREAGPRPLAVLNHSRLEFYALEPRLYSSLVERLNGEDLETLLAGRHAESAEQPAPVDLEVPSATT